MAMLIKPYITRKDTRACNAKLVISKAISSKVINSFKATVEFVIAMSLEP